MTTDPSEFVITPMERELFIAFAGIGDELDDLLDNELVSAGVGNALADLKFGKPHNLLAITESHEGLSGTIGREIEAEIRTAWLNAMIRVARRHGWDPAAVPV